MLRRRPRPSGPRPSLPFPGHRRLAAGTAQSLLMSISSSSSIRRLKDCPVVVDLYEFAPVGGRPAGGRDGRRFERFAEVREDLADRPWLRDERDQPDVAATVWALEGKLLTHPGQQFRRGQTCSRPWGFLRRNGGCPLEGQDTARTKAGHGEDTKTPWQRMAAAGARARRSGAQPDRQTTPRAQFAGLEMSPSGGSVASQRRGEDFRSSSNAVI